MKNLRRKDRWIVALLCAMLVYPLFSCKEEATVSTTFDPNKPIVCESFSPKGGPISTQVILTGQNFGNDPKRVKVYFNEKEAPVVGVNDDHMLVLAPRLPGENVVIKVVIDDKEASFKEHFDYQIQTNISTICGGDPSATSNSAEYPGDIVPLSEAQFSNEMSNNIVVDRNKNIFFGFDKYRYCANVEADRLKNIDEIGVFLTVGLVVYDPYKDRCYHIQSNVGNNEFWWYDVNNDFVKMDKGEMKWDNNDLTPGGMASWAGRREAVMNPVDHKFYTRFYQGYFGRFDPETGEAENLTFKTSQTAQVGSSKGNTYGMVFDKQDPNILYFTVDDLNCIYRYDISTGQQAVLTGKSLAAGFLDGTLDAAQFNKPHQMCVDSENNLYVADTGNHCIRKINLKTGFVSTVAGIPQSAGYANGTNESAKFNEPVGLAIDIDDILYVGDSKNHAIRRVAIE